MSSTRTYRINVENAKYAKILANTATAYTLDAIVDLPGVRSIDVAFELSTGKLYGDGSIASNISQIVGAVLKLASNKIAIEDRAVMNGQIYKDGILDVMVGDTPPDIAFYCEIPSDGNTKEQLWLLCGKTQPIGISGKQREDNITFSTDEVTMNFMKRAKDKKVMRLADTANSELTSPTSIAFEINPDAIANSITITSNSDSFDKNTGNSSYKDIVLTINSTGGDITHVEIDGNAVAAINYGVSGKVITIKKEYLVTIQQGLVIFTVYTTIGEASKGISIIDTTV